MNQTSCGRAVVRAAGLCLLLGIGGGASILAVAASVKPAPFRPNAAAASRVVEEAGRVARGIKDWEGRNGALQQIAAPTAILDTDQALRVVDDIDSYVFKGYALYDIAVALARTDPGKALAIARRPGNDGELDVFGSIAGTMAATDVDRALEAARSCEYGERRTRALHDIAVTVAKKDPRRALRIARSIKDNLKREQALADLAGPLAKSNLGTALAIARRISDKRCRVDALSQVASACIETNRVRARRVAAEAEEVARTIEDTHSRAEALAATAVVLAMLDPEEALRVADSVKRQLAWFWVGDAVAEAVACAPADAILAVARKSQNTCWRETLSQLVAMGLVETNPNAALAVAAEITCGGVNRDCCRDEVIVSLARTDAPAALEMVRGLPQGEERDSITGLVAAEWARKDLDRALATAREIEDDSRRAEALASIAMALLTPP